MTSSINKKRTEQIKEKKLKAKIPELQEHNAKVLLDEVEVLEIVETEIVPPANFEEVQDKTPVKKTKVATKKKTTPKKKVAVKKK